MIGSELSYLLDIAIKDLNSIKDNKAELSLELESKPVKYYKDSYSLSEGTRPIKLNLKENKDKSGIYCWFNKVSGDSYVGQSVNLSTRLSAYYSTVALKRTDYSIICRAILKYGHSNFSLLNLEYCEKSLLNEK